MKASRTFRTLVISIFSLTILAACGTGTLDQRTDGQTGTDDVRPGNQPAQSYVDPHIVRARWLVSVGDSNTVLPSDAMMLAAANTPIGAAVAASVSFNVDNSNFVEPIDPPEYDRATYGSIDITKLRDNNLKVCGASGTDRCTTGAIRIYTSGTPGPGLWNADEDYGLPILASDNEVGLDAAEAYYLATVDLTGIRVLRLRDFTADSPYQVPIEVDFGEAAAGSYGSTLVIEYVLQ